MISVYTTRRFYAAYLFSKSANSIFKILIEYPFWESFFVNYSIEYALFLYKYAPLKRLIGLKWILKKKPDRFLFHGYPSTVLSSEGETLVSDTFLSQGILGLARFKTNLWPSEDIMKNKTWPWHDNFRVLFCTVTSVYKAELRIVHNLIF